MVLVAQDVGEDGEALALLRMSPMAMPATGGRIGTPASMSESVAPQTVAIDEEPFDSVISDSTRIV